MIESFEHQTKCGNCDSPISEDETYCGECGYPENGTQEERTKFELRVSSRKRLLKDAKKKIKSAKTILYILAGLNILIGIIIFVTTEDFVSTISMLVVALIYLMLVVWTDKQPFAAILTAFFVYLTLIIISAIGDPSTLVSGFIWKIIIISAFVKGIKSGLEAKKLMVELDNFKVSL